MFNIRILFFSFLFLSLYATDYNPFFNKVGNYFNIESKIIKTLATIESGKNPNLINVNIRHKKNYYTLIKFLKKNHITYKTYKKKMVSFKVNQINYIKILNFLNTYHYSFDIGIMQINSSHTKSLFMQKLLLKNPFYNIYIGSKILRECFDRSKYDAYQTISCYNTGSIYKQNKSYIKKFFDNFKKNM